MNDTIRNQVQVTGTVAGDALTKLPTTDWGNRESIAIHNPDATYKLHVWVVDNGDSAPSLDLDTKFGSVDPGATNIFPFGPGIDVYLANSSGAATTSAYSVFETDMGGVLGLPASAGTPSVTATITGVATEAKQDTQITLLTSIDTHVQEIADTAPYTTGAGAVDASTQRVVLATDDLLASAVKAIDSVVGATDTGLPLLAKHQEDSVQISTANGDYDVLHVDSRGALVSNIEQHHVFDTFDATTGWTELGNDTLNLATTAKHIVGTAALTFDKVNGAANTVFAGIQKTLSSVDLGEVSMHDLIQFALYLPTITDVSYVFVRLGTDSSNYNEWRLADTTLTAATFLTASVLVGDASYAGITGNGWDASAVTYIAVGVAFDAETNTLAGIVFDEVSYRTNTHTSASLGVEVTSDVSTPNINVSRVGGTPTATGSGTVSAGTQRVTLASDDPAVTALQIIDDWDESDRAKVNLIAGQAGITGGAGAVAANTPRVVSADDSLDVAGSETIGTGQASVATTETAVVAARNNRHAVMIINHGTTAVYLGPTGLTTSTGVLLAGVAGASITIPTQAAIFGVVASGTQTVSYVELY